jgi:hypothetical protein
MVITNRFHWPVGWSAFFAGMQARRSAAGNLAFL